ncbi:MAG TPA: hypothetical protein VGB85_25655, partial [Nannocystis sp.]
FTCKDGGTVLLTLENNGSPDCEDGSDEHEPSMCLDGSDEPGCATFEDLLALLQSFGAYEPSCGGFFDPPCPESPDVVELVTPDWSEPICGGPYGPPCLEWPHGVEFKKFDCMDGKTIPMFSACNGIVDCDNGSDEVGCLNPFNYDLMPSSGLKVHVCDTWPDCP